MSFVLYVVVLIVSISSVMMGLDWLSTPPPALHTMVRTASAPAKSALTAVRAKSVETTGSKAQSTRTARSDVPKSAVAKLRTPKPAAKPPVVSVGLGPASAQTTAEASAQPVATDGTMTAMAHAIAGADEPTQPSATNQANPTAQPNASEQASLTGQPDAIMQEAAAPRCDVQACETRYHSFRASDCTYQPYGAPRRLCTVGNPPSQANSTPTGVQTSDARKQPASCNYQACGAAYYSFDAATCTYQPYGGPRRLCEK